MTRSDPEFSRIISAERVSPNGIEETLEAKPAERAALAQRFELIELQSLTAHLAIKPDRGSLSVTGTVSAEVVQTCVVTLETMVTKHEIPVDVLLLPEKARGEGDPLINEEEEDFDYLVGGKVDLGELAAQHLGVNIDPYPRKPGAELPQTEFGPAPEVEHPFAQLAALAKAAKNNDKSNG